MTADLDALRAALPSGLVALDFDGTLAPISPLPGDARPLDGAGPLLRDVRATGATLAVVTGRTVASLLQVSGFGVSASGRGPVAGQAGLTVPDPQSLMPLLRQILPVPAPAANPLI